AKADHPAGTARNRGLKSTGKTLALAADDRHAGAYGDTRLQCKRGNGDNAPRHRSMLSPPNDVMSRMRQAKSIRRMPVKIRCKLHYDIVQCQRPGGESP